jgi:hypothetical protein
MFTATCTGMIQLSSNKILIIFMVYLTVGANFVSSCPPDLKGGAEYHFALVACTAHECTRTSPLHDREQECHHSLCNDRFVFESSNRTESFHLDGTCTALERVVYSMGCSISTIPRAVPGCFKADFRAVTMPLRI